MIPSSPNLIISLSECKLTGERQSCNWGAFSRLHVPPLACPPHGSLEKSMSTECRAGDLQMAGPGIHPGKALWRKLVSAATCSRGLETAICSNLSQLTGEDHRMLLQESQMGQSTLRCKTTSREATGDTDQTWTTSPVPWPKNSNPLPHSALNINQISTKWASHRPSFKFSSGGNLDKLLKHSLISPLKYGI